MKVESKCSLGNDFMPIAGSGFCMHVLDWTPRIKDAWLALPMRIKDAIHPNREDRFFEFCSGSSYVSATLAPCFKQVEALDCRESAMQSSKINIRNIATSNMRFHRSHLDANFISKFFSKSDNAEGRWTFYINLNASDSLPSEVEHTLAASRPEREPRNGLSRNQSLPKRGLHASQKHPALPGTGQWQVRNSISVRPGQGGPFRAKSCIGAPFQEYPTPQRTSTTLENVRNSAFCATNTIF